MDNGDESTLACLLERMNAQVSRRPRYSALSLRLFPAEQPLSSLFPAEQPPQQYDLHDPRKKLAGIDCGLFCLFYAVALSYGGELTFSQEDMPVLRQRAVQLVVGQTSFI